MPLRKNALYEGHRAVAIEGFGRVCESSRKGKKPQVGMRGTLP